MNKKTKKKPPIQVEQKDGEITVQINVPISFTLKDVEPNRKLLIVLIRLFCDLAGKRLCTFAQIADLFGYKDRRNVNNFYREFLDRGNDFLAYLSRKVDNLQWIPAIEGFISKNLILPISEMHKEFVKLHNIKMSYPTFCSYISETNAYKLLRHVQEILFKGACDGNAVDVLTLVAEQNNTAIVCDHILEYKKKEKKEHAEVSEKKSSLERVNLCIFVLYLIGSGLGYGTISKLLGISKGQVHNLAYGLKNTKSMILNSIEKWSGKISIDEKYLRYKGDFLYVITIVDLLTGLPLFFDVYDSIKKGSYANCLRAFKLLYKTSPTLIVSDGSYALGSAIEDVFPNTKRQLCKFHKIRNLIKAIMKYTSSKKEAIRLANRAKKAFSSKNVSNRKRGFKRLTKILPKPAADYVHRNILAQWKLLTLALTANSSERFNRKIKKVTSGRYGLKSKETVHNLILALWLKELIEKGGYILNKDSLIANLKITQICQEKINWEKLDLEFSKTITKAA